jgi:hypothetical protein
VLYLACADTRSDILGGSKTGCPKHEYTQKTETKQKSASYITTHAQCANYAQIWP